MTKRIKIYGRKQKVRTLDRNEVIKKGDIFIFVYGLNNVNPSEEDMFQRLSNIQRPLETASAGDKVSDHPDRIYFRIV